MAEPRYAVGSKVRKFTCLAILGTEHTTGLRHDWVYQWQCECGNIERIPERNIARRKDCLTCSRIRNRRTGLMNQPFTLKSADTLPHHVPNPALLPVPATIKTGPEKWTRTSYRR